MNMENDDNENSNSENYREKNKKRKNKITFSQRKTIYDTS